MSNNPMMEPYAQVSWCPADVKIIREDWSDEKCMEMLDKVTSYLEDRSTEIGWEILEGLLALQEDIDDDIKEDE